MPGKSFLVQNSVSVLHNHLAFPCESHQHTCIRRVTLLDGLIAIAALSVSTTTMAPHDRDTAADTFRCVCVGCFCCYNGWDCQNPLLCCKCSEDFLCLRCSSCLACDAPSRGCGCVGDSRRGELCKIGCFCCNMGIAVPTKLCSCAGQCCCCLQVVSCPCTPEFVPCPGVLTLWFLGCCCIQVMPKCGCCVAAPPVRHKEFNS